MRKFIVLSLLVITFAAPSFATDPTPEEQAALSLAQKTVASKAYVDTKQDIIETGLVDLYDDGDYMLPAITTYDATSGLVSNKIGILDSGTAFEDMGDLNAYTSDQFNNFVPTAAAVANGLSFIWSTLDWKPFSWDSNTFPVAINAYSTTFDTTSTHVNGNWPYNQQKFLVRADTFANSLALKQNKIARAGYYYASNGTLTAYKNNSVTNGWLNAGVKGTGIVTKTATDGVVGERKIFEATDVANYHATGSTQFQQDLQDISIPTVGAVMNIVSTNAPTGTANTLANYDANGALSTGIATANAPAHNATTGELENGTNIATIAAVDTRQKKRTCAGYETGHENDPDYCWLWDFPDD